MKKIHLGVYSIWRKVCIQNQEKIKAIFYRKINSGNLKIIEILNIYYLKNLDKIYIVQKIYNKIFAV